ncbi:MAG TPA: hypothetical protein VKB39_02070, partial [Candidatus Baltobacteraceae bacterium]|nr:hypothetical protein [Candidatus Baltobacteraceae bacterium]
DPPPELAGLFRPSVQPFVISYMKYDPAKEIAKLSLPVTIVQGTADEQVTMDDANALKAADPSAKLVVIAGMNHLLKRPPDQAIDPHVVDAVASASQ